MFFPSFAACGFGALRFGSSENRPVELASKPERAGLATHRLRRLDAHASTPTKRFSYQSGIQEENRTWR
jgi:hypothetical protein